MASQVYNSFKDLLSNATFDWINDSIRVALLMTDTTADTDNDGIDVVSDIVNFDEFDGTGYSSGFGGGRIALAGLTKSDPDISDLSNLIADNLSGLSLGDGTRQIAGMLIYKHITSDAVSPVVCWIDDGGFPVDGSALPGVTWNVAGILTVGGP